MAIYRWSVQAGHHQCNFVLARAAVIILIATSLSRVSMQGCIQVALSAHLRVCKSGYHLLGGSGPVWGKHHELGQQGIIMGADSGAPLNPGICPHTCTLTLHCHPQTCQSATQYGSVRPPLLIAKGSPQVLQDNLTGFNITNAIHQECSIVADFKIDCAA